VVISRRSLSLPITLGVVMIVLVVVLTVGWVLLAVSGAISETSWSGLYWTLLAVGSMLLVMVLGGVIAYLVLSIKAISLNRRQSNFIDSVTHELKSPIASLKLYLQTLGRLPVTDKERADFYEFMLEDVERLDQLINHLLDAARLDREPIDAEIEDVELAAMLRECAAGVLVRYRVPAETVRVTASPCLVRARRVDLEVIFRNLIDNAVKYAGPEPRVEVRLARDPAGQAVVEVADNGRGVPLNLRGKIFGRFERLGLELERDKPGTGLGLYIVRTLVTRLRGKVDVRDRREGTGAVFEVRLPAAKDVPAIPAENGIATRDEATRANRGKDGQECTADEKAMGKVAET
jgi:signal transduction histidine kinase